MIMMFPKRFKMTPFVNSQTSHPLTNSESVKAEPHPPDSLQKVNSNILEIGTPRTPRHASNPFITPLKKMRSFSTFTSSKK